MKILPKEMKIIVESKLEECAFEDIQDALPDHQPRYSFISYPFENDDGRMSYPFFMIFTSPEGKRRSVLVDCER